MKKIALHIILLISFFRIYAQEVEFVASVDKNPVPVGERISVTFTINADASNFKGPSFKGFTVIGGPMQGQSIQVINNRMTRSLSFTYILKADKVGKYTIEPATIVSGGQTYKSNPIQVEVLPESDIQKQKRLQEEEKEKSLTEQANEILKKNIKLQVEVSKRNVYVGEQLTASYKLYINPQLNPIQMNPKKIPTFEGFWTQDLGIDKLNWSREFLDGVTYNVATIKQVVLFPQRAGKLILDPYEFEFVVRLKVEGQRRRSGSIFDDFFDNPFFSDSYRDFNYIAKSEALSINVNNLPDGAPSNFGGAVGNFNFEASLDKNKVKAGEPLSLKVKITGFGNLKLIDPPKVNFPPGFEVYDPKITDNSTVTLSGTSGSIIYEYIAIPRNSGDFKIEPIKLSYFDLSTQRYKELSSQEYLVTVEKGDNNQIGNLVTGVRKEEVELIGKDIRFIKLKTNKLEKNPKPFFGSIYFWLWSVTPFIFLLFLIIYRRKKLSEAQEMLQFRTRKATKLAKKRLNIAKKYLKFNQNDKFYEEINKALWGYISDKLLIPTSDLTKDNVKNILQSKEVSENIINKFLETLDLAEFARYAPSSNQVAAQDIYHKAIDVISEIEGEVKL
jgi:hypothetical protein